MYGHSLSGLHCSSALVPQVSNKWVDLEFNVVPYKESKDVFILGAIEDIQVRA